MIYFAKGKRGLYHVYFAYRRTACRPLVADTEAVTEPVTMLPPDALICSACHAWMVRSGTAVAAFTGEGIILRGAVL